MSCFLVPFSHRLFLFFGEDFSEIIIHNTLFDYIIFIEEMILSLFILVCYLLVVGSQMIEFSSHLCLDSV